MEYTYAGCTFVATETKEGYEITVKKAQPQLLKHLGERDAQMIAMYFNDYLPMKLSARPVVMPVTVTKDQVWKAIQAASPGKVGGYEADTITIDEASDEKFWDDIPVYRSPESIQVKPDIKVEKPKQKQLPPPKTES